MLGYLIEAVKALMNAAETWRQLGNHRKAKLADYFDNISKVLQQFVDMTREGKHSPGPCAELAQYAEAIRGVAARTLPGDKIEALADQLAHVWQNWQKIAPTGAPGAQAYDAYLD